MTTQARRALPWFRLYAEFAGDPVVQSLAFEDQRHFVVLLCLKCDGTLDRPISKKTRERIICRGLGLDPVTASEANRRLVEVGLISENWQPNGWEKWQSNDDDRPPSHEWKKIRNDVFVRDDFTCQYCGSRGVKLECDHVHPVSKGGGHDLDNLVTACFSCNRSKHDKTIDEWELRS